MKCTKMEGCGNDFVFVDYEQAQNFNLSDLSIKLCDRHYGIGADGAIYVKKNPLEFIYYNSDGSSSPFCGNGMRCFAKYCFKKGIVDSEEFHVKCSEWTVICHVSEKEIEVEIPEVMENKDGIICVCGSRHRVIEVNDLSDGEETYSDEYNLSYVKWINDEEIEIKTIERGAGITLACGSGSVASTWKIVKDRKISKKIRVKNKGGDVFVDIKNRKMSGPANIIFETELDVTALKRE